VDGAAFAAEPALIAALVSAGVEPNIREDDLSTSHLPATTPHY
jgi:hypothetical protein